MEVTAVQNPLDREESKATLQRTLSAIPSVSAPGPSDEPVKVSVSPNSSPPARSDFERLNQSISVVHALAEAADSISGLVDGIGNLAAQAAAPETKEPVRQTLELQAVSLAKEVRQTIDELNVKVSNLAPLTNDEVRNKIERELGKALDLLFPPERSDLTFDIRLSQKDSILNTIASVARARQRIEELRDMVREGNKKIEESVSTLNEVATANRTATEVSVRDLEEAAKLAESTSLKIGSDPSQAMQMAARLSESSASLLE